MFCRGSRTTTSHTKPNTVSINEFSPLFRVKITLYLGSHLTAPNSYMHSDELLCSDSAYNCYGAASLTDLISVAFITPVQSQITSVKISIIDTNTSLGIKRMGSLHVP